MDLSQYFQQLFAYHTWANQRVLTAAAQLSDDQFRQPQGHSHGTVYGMLLHMLSAEWAWLQRMQGTSPTGFLPQEEYPDLASLQSRWAQQAEEMQTFLKQQTAESLGQPISYTTTKGTPRTLDLWQILAHIANHGTHHRGELAAMFAQMNIPHEEEDMNQYFLK